MQEHNYLEPAHDKTAIYDLHNQDQFNMKSQYLGMNENEHQDTQSGWQPQPPINEEPEKEDDQEVNALQKQPFDTSLHYPQQPQFNNIPPHLVEAQSEPSFKLPPVPELSTFGNHNRFSFAPPPPPPPPAESIDEDPSQFLPPQLIENPAIEDPEFNGDREPDFGEGQSIHLRKPFIIITIKDVTYNKQGRVFYPIQTEMHRNMTYLVQRSYRDFQMTLQILNTQHPKKIVPTLSYEIIPKSETEKRKRNLQHIMDLISLHPDLSQTQMFQNVPLDHHNYQFIKMDIYDDFTNYLVQAGRGQNELLGNIIECGKKSVQKFATWITGPENRPSNNPNVVEIDAQMEVYGSDYAKILQLAKASQIAIENQKNIEQCLTTFERRASAYQQIQQNSSITFDYARFVNSKDSSFEHQILAFHNEVLQLCENIAQFLQLLKEYYDQYMANLTELHRYLQDPQHKNSKSLKDRIQETIDEAHQQLVVEDGYAKRVLKLLKRQILDYYRNHMKEIWVQQSIY